MAEIAYNSFMTSDMHQFPWVMCPCAGATVVQPCDIEALPLYPTFLWHCFVISLFASVFGPTAGRELFS